MRRIVMCLVLLAGAAGAQELSTVAESTEYRATARYAEVLEFCRRLDDASDLVRVEEVGRTGEGRAIPALVLSEGPAAGKLVVLAFAGIHAGEICGKEAFLALARDLASSPDRAILESLVVVLVPIYNADGNERVAKDHRPGQVGPDEGMGIRANATGLDLNRDFTKLEAPETRALVRFLRRWDPAIVIDSHTTNGSRHGYTITYDSPRHPAAHAELIRFGRDELLPAAGRAVEAATGQASFFYGNFAEGDRWETYPALPRYSTHYLGLTNRIGILSEAYAYATFRERVLATRAFVLEILRHAAANRDRIRNLVAEAAAARPGSIPLRCRNAPLGEPVLVRGEDGPRRCIYEGLSEPTLSASRPWAYVLDPELGGAVELLQRHGIAVEELREDLELDLEAWRVEGVERAEGAFEGHRLLRLAVSKRAEAAMVKAGSRIVRTDQALGTLAAVLLEAESDDGIAAWNGLEAWLAAGADYPVRRIPLPASLVARAVPALPEDRSPPRRLTFDLVHDEERPVSFEGDPVQIVSWPDADHYLQWRDLELRRVEAATGRSEPFHAWDLEGARRAIETGFGIEDGSEILEQALATHDPGRGRLVRHGNDLWYAGLDGRFVQLTRTPDEEERVPAFSPDDSLVAFVRGGDLVVVEIGTGAERALTSDGEGTIANGWLDWVYEEEVYGRGNRRGFWWSPDSRRIAFLRTDDAPVPSFTVLDEVPHAQVVEETRYPRAGEPNPLVRLGVVGAAGGEVLWADLSRYEPAATLVTSVGWTPGGDSVWFYVQDRIQTWLDVDLLSLESPELRILHREKTGAWVDNPGEPRFLADGSFLLPSERTGWRHLYRHAPDGTVLGALTSGPWEVREVHGVDEAAGWVYLSGTRDDAIAENLYRVRLDDSWIERLTFERGSHSAGLSPGAKWFVDSFSSFEAPTRVALRRADGSLARTLDTNPVPEVEDWELGRLERVRIRSRDGFDLEGTILHPPDFDPARKHPVWFHTYGGPHAPSVSDAWWGGRVGDQLLAALGFVVFTADPRSASGKGAVSTWTAYRQLGVQELADVEDAIRWLSERPWVDPERIGISGHSYGGFLAGYAMTHSRLFAAGIAGAPVTDWRLYDTIYTERYMDTPAANPEGYDRTSVVQAAKDLHGRLLIIHGAFDDNVHIQNTWQLVHALQEHDKDFELMVYPRSRHGIWSRHYDRLVVDFMVRTLRPGEGR